MVMLHRTYSRALDWTLLALTVACFAGSLLSLGGVTQQDPRFMGLLGIISFSWFMLAKAGDRVAAQG